MSQPEPRTVEDYAELVDPVVRAARDRQARRLRYLRGTCLSRAGRLRSHHTRDKDGVCIFCDGDREFRKRGPMGPGGVL